MARRGWNVLPFAGVPSATSSLGLNCIPSPTRVASGMGVQVICARRLSVGTTVMPAFRAYPCGEAGRRRYAGPAAVATPVDFNLWPRYRRSKPVLAAANIAKFHHSGVEYDACVDHGGGWTTGYAHLDTWTFDSPIEAGERIWMVGGSGVIDGTDMPPPRLSTSQPVKVNCRHGNRSSLERPVHLDRDHSWCRRTVRSPVAQQTFSILGCAQRPYRYSAPAISQRCVRGSPRAILRTMARSRLWRYLPRRMVTGQRRGRTPSPPLTCQTTGQVAPGQIQLSTQAGFRPLMPDSSA